MVINSINVNNYFLRYIILISRSLKKTKLQCICVTIVLWISQYAHWRVKKAWKINFKELGIVVIES